MQLIDKNALNMHLADIQLSNRGRKDEFCDILDDIMQMVDDMPTVDAVPVVRCRDCKYHDGKHYCFYNDDCVESNDFCSKGVRDDGFCCYGERRCE